jgi:hypothetical protein
MKVSCRKCAAVIEVTDKIGFRDTCPSCDEWLHSCVHCRFWSGGRCTEPAAEKAGDPEGRNFCEWFRERTQADGRGAQEDEGRASAEDLWKKLTRK